MGNTVLNLALSASDTAAVTEGSRSGYKPPSLFLAKGYVPGATRHLVAADAARARQAGRASAAQGIGIRYLSSALVPADETCFVLFEACSADQVRPLPDRAALPHDHIVEAVLIEAEDP